MEPEVPIPSRWTDDASHSSYCSTMHTQEEWAHVSPQLRPIFLILGRTGILHINATGFGKSCAFSIPILVLNEYNKTPELFPSGLRHFLKPVGLVITPTKGLANNLVRGIGCSGTEYDTYLVDLGQRTVLPRCSCTRLHIGDSCRVSAQEGRPPSAHSTL